MKRWNLVFLRTFVLVIYSLIDSYTLDELALNPSLCLFTSVVAVINKFLFIPLWVLLPYIYNSYWKLLLCAPAQARRMSLIFLKWNNLSAFHKSDFSHLELHSGSVMVLPTSRKCWDYFLLFPLRARECLYFITATYNFSNFKSASMALQSWSSKKLFFPKSENIFDNSTYKRKFRISVVYHLILVSRETNWYAMYHFS